MADRKNSFLLYPTRIFTAACLCGLLAVTTIAAANDWPQFLGPNGDGTSPEKGLMRAWPAGGPKVLWTRSLAVGFAPASVRDGKVYVLDRVDQKQDVLRCLDLQTGKEEWTFAYDAEGKLPYDGTRCTPAITDKFVYIVGPFGHFHCLDKATHQVVWKKHLLNDLGGKLPRWGVAQSAVVYKDMVVVAPQSDKMGVAAFDLATGQERWHSPALPAASRRGQAVTMEYSTPRLITVDGVDQFVLMTLDGIRSVSAADGKVLWSYIHPCQIPIANVTPLGNGKVFVTGGYLAGSSIIQLKKDADKWTVAELAKIDKIGGHCHVALVYQDHFYMLCNINERSDGMVCFDFNGKILWQTNKSPNLDKGGSILTADGLIYQVDGATGELYIVQPSPDGFKSLGKVKVLEGKGKTIWSPLALVDGKLILRDQNEMKCLDIKGQ